MAAEPVTAYQAVQILTAMDRAERDGAYAESLKMDAQQIEGTRYRIRLNEAQDIER